MGSPEPGRCSSQVCKTCDNNQQDCDRKLPPPRISPRLLDPIFHEPIIADRFAYFRKTRPRRCRITSVQVRMFGLFRVHSFAFQYRKADCSRT